MRTLILLLVMFFTTQTSSFSTGIDELLGKASTVVEGAVIHSHVDGSATTLKIEVSSVLLGSVRPGDTITVECNSLKHVFQGLNPQPWAYPQIFFLRAIKLDSWACVPVDMRGHSALGYLGYPQTPPCPEGALQVLGPQSVRERILTRVAESALCGARPSWPRVLDASSRALATNDSPNPRVPDGISDFDRRLFRELVKSPRRELHIEAIQALLTLGDPLPFDLLATTYKEYRNSKQEWWTIGATIERTLEDPAIIPQLKKLLPIKDAQLQLAIATALQRFHTPAAVVILGKMLEAQDIEKPLALVAAKGLAEFANGCPMTTQGSFKTPADFFPHCDEKAPFRTDETVKNSGPGAGFSGDDNWHITFWKHWWSRNDVRVAALAAQ